MNSLSKILLIISIILITALIVVLSLYFDMRKTAKNNLEETLKVANELFEINKKLRELEEKLNTSNSTSSHNITSISNVPNDTNITISDEISKNDEETTEFNRSPDNVTIQVIDDTITKESAYILITDNNTTPYGWGEDYSIQKKVNNNWEEIEPNSDLAFNALAHIPDKNNQLILKVNYGKDFKTLDSGTYRIVKSVYDNGYIDIFSNEFNID